MEGGPGLVRSEVPIPRGGSEPPLGSAPQLRCPSPHHAVSALPEGRAEYSFPPVVSPPPLPRPPLVSSPLTPTSVWERRPYRARVEKESRGLALALHGNPIPTAIWSSSHCGWNAIQPQLPKITGSFLPPPKILLPFLCPLVIPLC